MRLYALIALVGIILIVTQPMLRAQDSKAEKERAIAEIKKLGGKVEVDTKSPDMPVIGVNLKHTKVVDASLEHLKGLTKLQILFLKDTDVTDDGMIYVKGLTNLEVLELGRTQVTDKGLEQLQALTSLQILSLENTISVSDFGLVHLKGLTNLRELNIGGTKVTDAGVQDLQEALPKARIIH